MEQKQTRQQQTYRCGPQRARYEFLPQLCRNVTAHGSPIKKKIAPNMVREKCNVTIERKVVKCRKSLSYVWLLRVILQDLESSAV